MKENIKEIHNKVRDLLFNTNLDNVVSKNQTIDFLYNIIDVNTKDDFQNDIYKSIKRLYVNYFDSEKKKNVDNEKLINKTIKFGAHFYNLFSKRFNDEDVNNKNYFFEDSNKRKDFERKMTNYFENPLGLSEDDLKPVNTNDVFLIIGCLTKSQNIDIDLEARIIEKNILSNDKNVSVVKYISVYDEFISKAINYYKPKYLHFIGHSDPTSIYVFDRFEREKAITSDEFNKIFNNKFELLFLNSCYSIKYLKSMSSKNYLHGLGYIDSISDYLARYIAFVFYDYYFKKKSFKDSYHMTIKQIENEITGNKEIVYKYGEKQCKPGEIIENHLTELAEHLQKYLNRFLYN